MSLMNRIKNGKKPARKRWVLTRFFSRVKKSIRKRRSTPKADYRTTMFFVEVTELLLSSKYVRKMVAFRYRNIMMKKGLREFDFGDKKILALNQRNADRKYQSTLNTKP